MIELRILPTVYIIAVIMITYVKEIKIHLNVNTNQIKILLNVNVYVGNKVTVSYCLIINDNSSIDGNR